MLLLTDRAVRECPLPLITRDEARMLGTTLGRTTHVRLRRGIHVRRAEYLDLKPWEQYAVRVHAFIRKHPDAVLCLESAAVLHGLPLFRHPRDIHVFDPDARTSQRFGDVCVHASADPRDVVRIAGAAVTSLLDTVADLARVTAPARALAVVDSAISPAQGGDLLIDAIRERVGEQQNGRGRAQLRWVCDRADGRSESPAESVSRAVIEWCGYEEPQLQHEFRYEGSLDRVDFLFPTRRTIGEADGWGKYRLDDPEAAAQNLRDEKRREDRLRRHGHPFARWDLTAAWRVTPLTDALRAAGLTPKHPTQSAMLATLARGNRDRRS
ncbi:hypothetical protein [Microbacterium sp. YJN-G]|uniref:hypothetical protein n=1 Tax=Microbacterium sp. YJN-G TaxID=2763257 RepID=UPI0018775225|nr:hypothetical protein [Microbacterium sp. YJN-G]